ncbi:DUF7453 family protein [Aeoliella mucimassa]|nr:choice-of-anchor tandem repeat NxxGxxAF-containing protein [Aeoliella mucimassa]
MADSRVACCATIVIAVDNGEGPANGDPTPTFSSPVLNEAGQAAFSGFRVGGYFSPVLAGGVYVGDGINPLQELVKTGDPGITPDSLASSFVVRAINDSGVVAYEQRDVATDNSPLANSTSAVLNNGYTAPTIVVHEGDSAPGGDRVDFIRINDLDANGRLGLSLRLVDGSGPESAVLFDSTTGLATLATVGQPAPDGEGVVGGAFYPALNDAGQTLYTPRIARAGLPERPAIFRDTPGVGRELLFRSGDPTTSPNVDGSLLLELYNPSMNAHGRVAFYGSVADASTPAGNGLGLFVVDTPNGATAVVREGETVPGGDTFAGFGRPSLNDEGDLAFYALLTDDPNAELDRENVGLYRYDTSGLVEIVREGQLAPSGDGTIDLPRFLPISSSAPNMSIRPMFNDAGEVAFLADLNDTASGNEDAAIYYFNEVDGLQEVVRTGTPLLGSIITDLGLQQNISNSGYEEDGFNNAGQIAYRFSLADGRHGVALWSTNSIPEPTSVALVSMAALLVACYRRFA